MRRATTAWYTFLVKNLLNLPSVILVLIFANVKTLIMLILFLEQASGRPTWSLRATWCPWALRWWLLVYTFGCTCFTYTALNICFFIISNWPSVVSSSTSSIDLLLLPLLTSCISFGELASEEMFTNLHMAPSFFVYSSSLALFFFWKNFQLSVARFICKLKCFTDS